VEVEQFLYLGLPIAEGAFGILFDLKCSEFHIQGIVNQKLADQGFSLFQNELDGFGCLN
jgi:hypothetical protein